MGAPGRGDHDHAAGASDAVEDRRRRGGHERSIHRLVGQVALDTAAPGGKSGGPCPAGASGEVAKWLGNGLQNHHTPVRIRSSPRRSHVRTEHRRASRRSRTRERKTATVLCVTQRRTPRPRGLGEAAIRQETRLEGRFLSCAGRHRLHQRHPSRRKTVFRSGACLAPPPVPPGSRAVPLADDDKHTRAWLAAPTGCARMGAFHRAGIAVDSTRLPVLRRKHRPGRFPSHPLPVQACSPGAARPYNGFTCRKASNAILLTGAGGAL